MWRKGEARGERKPYGKKTESKWKWCVCMHQRRQSWTWCFLFWLKEIFGEMQAWCDICLALGRVYMSVCAFVWQGLMSFFVWNCTVSYDDINHEHPLRKFMQFAAVFHSSGLSWHTKSLHHGQYGVKKRSVKVMSCESMVQNCGTFSKLPYD